MNDLSLKEAKWEDADLLFEWANDPETRRNSFNTKKIEYDEHLNWLKNNLANSKSLLYIVMLDEKAVGQLRLDFDENNIEISYSISKENRGKGIGSALIEKTIEHIRHNFPLTEKITAKVKPENLPSIACFEKNGFKETFRCFEVDVKER